MPGRDMNVHITALKKTITISYVIVHMDYAT
jgi:hypothetical protein